MVHNHSLFRGLSGLTLLFLFALALAAPSPTSETSINTTDYLIVGGGPAGLVIAEQLTRNPHIRVVLLEAGPDSSLDPIVTTPAEFFNAYPYFWNFSSAPDPALDGRTPELNQGRALGGGSAVNGMGYCRGASSVFDEWAHVSGNPGLSWKSMLEAFKATTHFQEDVHPEDQTAVNMTSFGDGPLEITTQRFQLGFDKPFVNKLLFELDVPEIDFCSGDGIGVTEQVDAIRADNRTRSYAWNTFGWLAAARSNFEVRHDAWVSKIGFHGKTANSVTYNNTLTNSMHTINAHEIIVAAGAIGSPQLLMLSGIGPEGQLKALGVPVVLNAPQVGQNLIDHHTAQLVYETVPAMGTTWQWQLNITAAQEAEEEYSANGGGLLGVPDGNVFAAFRLPDAVFDGLGSYHTSLPADRPHFIYEYTTAPFQTQFSNRTTITPFVALVQPEARGNVTLASADYRDQPIINSAYWGTPADKAAILYAYKKYRAFFATPELQPWVPVELFPGADITSDDGLWAAIQESSGSFHHPMGTVAIGSVLDTNWRVRGVQGLRVVGSPAAPSIITCHTQATAYALGYRAAKDIAVADGI
ncbi:putative GMC oxidoreductase [Xylaria scruposa]|nr:putative GMC oxidoreductase [Xylaria scruposa]